MEEVRLDRDGASLAVSYSPGGETAVVAVHGAGMGTRDWFLYRHLHSSYRQQPVSGSRPSIAVATVSRPVLRRAGTSLPVESSIDVWRRARGDDVEINVIRGTGHEPTADGQTIVPAYEQRLVGWLRERALPAHR